MRTNIVIDEKLLAEAIEATGAKTKREAVELGLAALVKLNKQKNFRSMRGKVTWTGDLEEMRNSAA
ncbi:MAG: type II toxin-antitoxin system VapB family antitoxin [Pseudomonadales bacterium]|nr:type II toxin-antitoxin system VapB family antitoxin [Pseudomonadales bacterium]